MSCEYTKNHQIEHFKYLECMICELYLNKSGYFFKERIFWPIYSSRNQIYSPAWNNGEKMKQNTWKKWLLNHWTSGNERRNEKQTRWALWLPPDYSLERVSRLSGENTGRPQWSSWVKEIKMLQDPKQLEFIGQSVRKESPEQKKIWQIFRGSPSSIQLSGDQCKPLRKLPEAKENLPKTIRETNTQRKFRAENNACSHQWAWKTSEL